MAKAKQSLAEYRRSLAAAELTLLKARNDLRRAVKREGRPTDGIFSKTKFVPRETALRWTSEARREATSEIVNAVQSARKAMDEPGSSPFAHFAAHFANAASTETTPAPAEAPQAAKPTLIVDNTPSTTNEPSASPAA